MKTCYHCQQELSTKERIGRRDTCPQCSADLHCCFNCMFYERQAANECREPNADRVLDKEVGNFCEYFSFTESRQQQTATTNNARAQLEALFKKK